jgi:hypothetical protein
VGLAGRRGKTPAASMQVRGKAIETAQPHELRTSSRMQNPVLAAVACTFTPGLFQITFRV